MLTPFMTLKGNQKQRQDNNSSNNSFKIKQKKQKIFSSPRTNYLTQATLSNNNQQKNRKWSSLSQRQKYEHQKQKQSRVQKSKTKPQPNEDGQNKKNNQILIRQSLRRSLAYRLQNHTSLSGKSIRWVHSSRKIIENKSQTFKQRSDFFDDLHELQGVKCIINTPTKLKYCNSEEKRLRNKSMQNSQKKQRNQVQLINLNIIDDQSFDQNIVALGMASKKTPLTQSFQGEQQKKLTTSNKIAISTSQCFVIAQPNIKKISLNPSLIIQSQTNFIRAHKKSKALTKKVANLQKQQQKIEKSKIFSFKNSLNKNLNLQINNTKAKKINNIVKKQQNIKISGWELQPGWDIQGNF